MTDPDRADDAGLPAPLERARQILAGRGATVSDAAVRILAREVLRRLSQPRGGTPPASPLDAGRVRDLAMALIGTDGTLPARIVAQLRTEGHDLDALHQRLLAAAVRDLGALWDDDRISLTDVVVGTGRVYALLRELREQFFRDRATQSDTPRALFATVPGEMHTLGAVMAADHFRARGWAVDLLVGASQSTIVEAAESHVIIVFAARFRTLVLPLARLVVALRVVNPAAYVVIAGGIAAEDPEIAALVDADAAAPDIESAERCLDQALALVRPPSPQVRR